MGGSCVRVYGMMCQWGGVFHHIPFKMISGDDSNYIPIFVLLVETQLDQIPEAFLESRVQTQDDLHPLRREVSRDQARACDGHGGLSPAAANEVAQSLATLHADEETEAL